MSLLPWAYYDWFNRPSRLSDQHFGTGLFPEDFLAPLAISPRPFWWSNYWRPWRSPAAEKDVGSTVIADKDKFQVNLDVQHFSPEEITVKASDEVITIEGKHEERPDEHGLISRHFVRKYALPNDYSIDDVRSSLSSDGVLTVIAPKRALIEGKEERVIPITHTGPTKAVEGKKDEK